MGETHGTTLDYSPSFQQIHIAFEIRDRSEMYDLFV